jgi:hypothetical protein
MRELFIALEAINTKKLVLQAVQINPLAYQLYLLPVHMKYHLFIYSWFLFLSKYLKYFLHVT